MTIRELNQLTRIHRVVILDLQYPVKVIDTIINTNAINNYLDKNIIDIKPFIENKIDYDGMLRATPRIEVYIYE